jgi:hypothetical protein
MENYNLMTMPQLWALMKERNIRGKSFYPKNGLVKCLEDYDRVTHRGTNQGNSTQPETTSPSDQQAEHQEVSHNFGVQPSSKLQSTQLNHQSSRANEVLAILRQDIVQNNPNQARNTGDDDIARIAELFMHLRKCSLELPVLTSPSTFFARVKAHMRAIYPEKVPLHHKESDVLFSVLGIRTDVVGTPIAPQGVTDLFVLRHGLIAYLDKRANYVPAEEKKFPHNFTKDEVKRLSQWYLEMEQEHSIDAVAAEVGSVDAKELFAKLESIFAETTSLKGLSQSQKTTKSIVEGLHTWRRSNIQRLVARKRKRAASTLDGSEREGDGPPGLFEEEELKED